MTDYEELYKQWAADKYNIPIESIKSVEFTSGMGGYCETCEYSTFFVEIRKSGIAFESIEESATEVINSILNFQKRMLN